MTTAVDDVIELVRRKAEKWADELIDFGPRNTLLYYRDTKTYTLDLTEADPTALDAFLSGRKTRLAALVTGVDEHKSACVRARNLRKRIVELEEEQGVDAGRLARGLLRVEPPAARETASVPRLRAPLLLHPVSLRAQNVAETDFTLEFEGEVEVNQVLLYALSRWYGMDGDVDAFNEKLTALLTECADPAEQIRQVYRAIVDAVAPRRATVSHDERVLLGLFSYDKLPMVQDLRNSVELLASHDVIAAAAGHRAAADALRAGAAGVQFVGADDLPPKEEFFVQDADSSQQRAINSALAGGHVLIEGPPGTGKSQTIANIIACMAARGKRVLFVAEKRAAIEAVTQRLEQVDLNGLVFDLHQQKISRKQVAQQLAETLERASRELPPDTDELHKRLADRRKHAVRHPVELHTRREPWGVSAFQVQSWLLELPTSSASAVRFRGGSLRKLSGDTRAEVKKDLQDFIDQGGLRVRRGESPWSHTPVRNRQEIEPVLAHLDQLTGSTLRGTRSELESLIARTGLPRPTELSGWQDILGLLNEVGKTVAVFGDDVFGTQLDDWHYATANRRWRSRKPRPVGFWQRRNLLKQIRSMRKDGLRGRRALHRALSAAMSQRDLWRNLARGRSEPASLPGLEKAMEHYTHLRDQLAAVSLCAQLKDLEKRPAADVADTLDELSQDRDTLYRMPELNRLTDRFEALGLGQLLDELARRDADAGEAVRVFEWAWLTSVLDEFKLRVPHLGRFVGQQHFRVVEQFRQAAAEHLRSTAQRVRYLVATRLREARDAHPQQSLLVRGQANRKARHLAVRKLVDKAPDVLLAARPCWAMSPLVVSRVLPAARLFDVVIFDEASQVEPHDAMASIMRGRQLVVAGDDKQLPPTPFFRRVLGGEQDVEEDTEEEGGDLRLYESILKHLGSMLPDRSIHMLRWHYRSRDERLIAFSNEEIYRNKLVTFPGTFAESPIRLDLVDGFASPGQDGSAPEEINRVVRLVLEHAEQRPDESLGVIAMGQRHADRIEAALRAARRERSDLEPFFSEEGGTMHRFFVKNLERVQGDERDAIIMSVGYAKAANGRVPMRFGALNNEGGERRLNVAVTRARRRMTVVSSFSHHDLDPNVTVASKNRGPELLRRFLEFAAHGGNLAMSGQPINTELNGFEESVLNALKQAGVPVTPQWGVSGYRIDFALAHRDRRGRMVLAVETDGERYHRSESARDRDRLRQAHLERLGWRFHRLWSTDWFRDPKAETDRIVQKWHEAMDLADREPELTPIRAPEAQAHPMAPVPAPRRGPRPNVHRKERIGEYSERELLAICQWLLSDQLQIDREERIRQAMAELGFQKRGKVIAERLNRAFDRAREDADRGRS